MSTIAQSDNTVYLDYAAAAPIDPEVLAMMLPYFGRRYGNASSMHTSGRRAAHAVREARGKAAAVLKCDPQEIIFTGSGTESDNLALFGVARANRMHGTHVIISAIEHKAVLESVKQLEREGFEVSVAPVLQNGLIDLDAFERLLREDTILVSIMYANNEIGTVEPVAEIATRIKKYRGQKHFPLLHTDACQAAGFLTLDVAELGVDLMTLNGSKIYGPKGVGMLYKKNDVPLAPLVVGGEQEMHLRAGTESIPLIVGFSEALAKAESLRDRESARLAALRDYFLKHLQKKIPQVVLNGHPLQRLPNNINISIPFVEGEAMLLMLDKAGVEASTGSACSAYDLKPSHVLLAIGQAPELAHGSIRFSLGRSTTKEELDYVLSVFPTIVERLTLISASTGKRMQSV
jgi:cysteine desulfurase